MKKRFTAGTMCIVMLALAVSALAGAVSLYMRETANARKSLRELLCIADAQVEALGPAQTAAIFKRAAPDKRLTIIAPDGTVLADTEGGGLENHAGRPEVLEAAASGWGEASRPSKTLGTPLLYVAKRFADGGIGRAAMPLSTVDALVWQGLPPLLVAAAAALLLAFPLSRSLAGRLVKPLKAVDESLLSVLGGGGTVPLEPADSELQPVLRHIGLLVGRLNEYVEELKKAENVRAQFTANVSHELKTPLTSIKGVSDLLLSGVVKREDQKQFFTLIGVETDRLIALINDILKMSELENAVIDQPDETASLLEIAEETAALLAPAAASRGVALSVDGEPGLAGIPPGRGKELLINLMENAIKYNRETGGWVHVAVRNRGEMVEVSVADNGIGIPEQDQPHVFERFYRVDKSRSRENGGTGLGLSIVKHICQLYGGRAALESSPGMGSTFTVTLPAARAGISPSGKH